ncbi:hypothetical protein E2320_003023, partial [Naja naja]
MAQRLLLILILPWTVCMTEMAKCTSNEPLAFAHNYFQASDFIIGGITSLITIPTIPPTFGEDPHYLFNDDFLSHMVLLYIRMIALKNILSIRWPQMKPTNTKQLSSSLCTSGGHGLEFYLKMKMEKDLICVAFLKRFKPFYLGTILDDLDWLVGMYLFLMRCNANV